MLLRLLFPEASMLLLEGACPNASLHILPTPILLGTGILLPSAHCCSANPSPTPAHLNPPLLAFTRPCSPSTALAHLHLPSLTFARPRSVRITDRALVVAAELSDRYITGRFLPDKAIDLSGWRCCAWGGLVGRS